MITVDGTYIHGLRTRYADDGVEVYYAFPGALEVRLAAGITMPPAARPQEVVLGLLLADPDEQDPREDRSWRWPAQTTPATRRWAQHVVAADHREESLVYEHDGELVLVWASVPARAHELALLELGFTPALATWRAPATTETRTLAAKLIQQGPLQTPPVIGAAPPLISTDHEHDHADAVEHAWLRWAALMDTRVLKLQQRSYDFRAPPQRDGSALVLHYRTRNADLRLTLDVARHPLIYDITVAAGERGKSLTPHAIPGVAWADFPALVDEIARIVAGKPATPVVTPPAPVVAPPATPISGEQMEGPYRRADIWETVIASVLAGFDLPELLPLYPLTQRLTRAALTAIDEQAAQHGADYIESLRRRDSVQVARLAQLEQRLFAVLTEAEPLGALTELVRHVIGLADGSIRRPPAGTASEAFWRTWTAPGALTLRGHVFPLRSHQVLFESTTVELRYRFPVVPGAPMPTLTLSIGLPNPRGQCEVRATLWNFGAPEQSPPWTLTVPQLEKLTGPQVLRQLKPVATPSPAHDNAETWEDALVTAFKAQDARDPQLRLERRLGSGSRIFVLTMPGRRPEPIVGRVDINADLEIESVHLEPLRPEAQTTLRRRLESALEVVRESLGDDDTPPDYATARKKALTEAPPPALVDKLARHLARQREAAAVLPRPAPTSARPPAWSWPWRYPRAPRRARPPSGSTITTSAEVGGPAQQLHLHARGRPRRLHGRPVRVARRRDGHPAGLMAVRRHPQDLSHHPARDGADGPYVLEAVGTRVRTHPVTVREQDDRFARVEQAGQGPPSVPRRRRRASTSTAASRRTVISDVWERYDGLVQSLTHAPVAARRHAPADRHRRRAGRRSEDARGRQGERPARPRGRPGPLRRAAEQLARGRDARALDRLREVLRAVVQVAHSSAESCAAGQTACWISAEPAPIICMRWQPT
jgi:hypothetical protein